MRLLLLISLGWLILANVFVIYAQETSGLQANAAQQELITLSEQWMQALERKDQATLERFLADGFYISPPGALRKTGRSEWLKNAQEMNWSSLKYRNFKVDIYGDAAVVTSLLDFKVTNRWGIPVRSDTQVTDIWVKRNGQWKVAARHLGAASLREYVRLGTGFMAGLALCLMVWLLLKLKRRFTAKRQTAAT